MQVYKTQLKEALEVKGLFVIHECIRDGIYVQVFPSTHANMNVNGFALQHFPSTLTPDFFFHSVLPSCYFFSLHHFIYLAKRALCRDLSLCCSCLDHAHNHLQSTKQRTTGYLMEKIWNRKNKGCH